MCSQVVLISMEILLFNNPCYLIELFRLLFGNITTITVGRNLSNVWYVQHVMMTLMEILLLNNPWNLVFPALFLNLSGSRCHCKTHSGEKPFTCVFCSELGVDINNGPVSITPLMCSFVPHSFSHLGVPRGHCVTHSGEKPFTCEICSSQLYLLLLFVRLICFSCEKLIYVFQMFLTMWAL